MFSQKTPRTTARDMHIGRRVCAAATTLVLGAGFALAGAASAQAADSPKPDSWSRAQFLSGSALGLDLDEIARLTHAEAFNDGDDPFQSTKDPFSLTALKSLTLGTGDSVQTDLGGLLQLGVVGQYAEAGDSGDSMATTGAVTDDGGIGVGQDNPLPGTDAVVDLDSLLGDGFAANLASLDLNIRAIGASARAAGDTASGDYTLADLTLTLTSPAISQLTEKVDTALDSIDQRADLLSGQNGALIADLNRILQRINPSINLLGAGSNATASIDTGDLKALVADLLTNQIGEDGVTVDLETGVVTADLEALLGGDINDMPAGTEVLSDVVLDRVLTAITDHLSSIADSVVDRVEAALHTAKVNVHAAVDLDVAQTPLVQQICQTVTKTIQVPTQVITKVAQQVPVLNGVVGQVVNGVPQINGIPVVNGVLQGTGLIGGLLGTTGQTVTWITQYVDQTVVQYVAKVVDDVVCSNKVTPLPTLKTAINVDMNGTVDQFISGDDVQASASVKVLGIVDHTLNLGSATQELAQALTAGLFDGDDSAVRQLTDALHLGLVDPAKQGLLDGAGSVSTALTDLLSIRVNVQDLADGVFTQTALQITVLGGVGDLGAGGGLSGALGTARSADSGVAQINMAQASVGPNVGSIVDEDCMVDCKVGGVDITPGGNTPAGISRLAMTGAGIAILIALVLALLAAGAYLVRENYRKTHAVPIA